MHDDIQLISKSSLVLSIFKEWPSFHDAEVLAVSLDRKNVKIGITLDVIELSVRERYERARITFEFLGAELIDLYGFNHQNVISGISFKQEGEKICVEILSCHGLGGTWKCSEVKVVSCEKQ